MNSKNDAKIMLYIYNGNTKINFKNYFDGYIASYILNAINHNEILILYPTLKEYRICLFPENVNDFSALVPNLPIKILITWKNIDYIFNIDKLDNSVDENTVQVAKCSSTSASTEYVIYTKFSVYKGKFYFYSVDILSQK